MWHINRKSIKWKKKEKEGKKIEKIKGKKRKSVRWQKRRELWSTVKCAGKFFL